MSEPPLAIEVIDVVKTFDRGVLRPLDGISLSVAAGEWVALSGPSGCGKSTLLHLIAALDRPTSGRILVNGRDLGRVGNLDRFRRMEVGLVFQLHNLLPNLNALQNIEVAMFGSGRPHHKVRERAAMLLNAVDLQSRGHVRPPALSGGERQRLAIARALANEPPILLADEPTGSLDSRSSANVLDLFRRIRSERPVTILLVTHDQGVAAAADRILRMQDGRIVVESQGEPGAREPRQKPAAG
jgi:putative ABC transport system ATP-binding protein